jgi:type VII secretion integral membrane protein EccD
VDEIATHARRHGRTWGPTATRLVSLGTAGLILAAVLAVLVVTGSPQWSTVGGIAVATAALLLGTGTLLSRAVGDAVVGAAAAGFALPYATIGGFVILLGGGTPGPAQVFVSAAALLLASVLGAVGVGHGLRVFTAGGVLGAACVLAALIGSISTAAGAAAVVLVALVGGVGLAPGLAVRAGRLPLPVISAEPDALAGEPRPDRPKILSAVIRADEVLAGLLLGIAVTAVLCVAVLTVAGGGSGQLMAACAAAALLLRARPLPTVAARLPLVLGGATAAVLTGWSVATGGGPVTRVVVIVAALVAVAAALGTGAVANRRRERSPYLARIADGLDLIAVVALPPIACAVLGLYGFVRVWTGNP